MKIHSEIKQSSLTHKNQKVCVFEFLKNDIFSNLVTVLGQLALSFNTFCFTRLADEHAVLGKETCTKYVLYFCTGQRGRNCIKSKE